MTVQEQIVQAVTELCDVAKLQPGQILVVGCSTSEVRGSKIGTDSAPATGEELGKLTEVLTPPAHPVYRVTGGEREYLIPAVPAFIAETDIDGGFLRVTLIEGM